MSKELYKVSFSNQKLEAHVSGEIFVNASSAKMAIKSAASIISIPGGAFFVATKSEMPKAA